MDSCFDGRQHESCVKRIKLDLRDVNPSELCDGGIDDGFFTSAAGQIDISEGISADCDSGYEPSSIDTVQTPSHQPSYTPETLSETYGQTPTYTDNLDTSQDSIENDDDNASTVSHISDLSGLSELSGQDWKPMAGSMIWIQKQMHNGVNPRTLLNEMGVDLDQIPQYVDEVTLWKLIINMLAEPPRRNKLRHVNTLDDVVRLLKGAQNIIILTGAGVSVSCGIPDFRSRDGIYSRLAIDFPDLPDPQAMFDISYFSQDPRPFFKFARDIYPGKFQPSPCHRFIKLVEKQNKLLRNYTQNIDTLEKVANIDRVIECHGSFATATCTKCNHQVTAEHIKEIVLAQQIPLCEKCNEGKPNFVSTLDVKISEGNDYRELVASGIMKPDIVFFGEGLPESFHESMSEDKSKCDLLLVIGSSLKVRPVALIPSSLPPDVPQILINREPLPQCHFDVELLGDCDVIVNHLCQLLGSVWEEGICDSTQLQEVSHLLPLEESLSDNGELEITKEAINLAAKDVSANEVVCKCNLSTKSSSLTVETCKCYQTSITLTDKEQMHCFELDSSSSDLMDTKSGKERHMSIDSARDSGIGDNSNFTDLETKYEDELSEENSDDNREPMKKYSESSSISSIESKRYEAVSSSELRGFWQPKLKKSLAERLPPNSFHLVPPSRYIFPGAEVFYDPDEKFCRTEDISSSDSSGSETDSETKF